MTETTSRRDISELHYQLPIESLVYEVRGGNVADVDRIHTEEFKRILRGIKDFWLTDEEIEHEVGLGFHEMVVNAIENGNNSDSDKSIKIELHVDAEKLQVSVADHNNPDPFDPTKVADSTAQENLLTPSGRGIFFANIFFDEVKPHFENPGNKFTMVRKRIRPQREIE